MSLATAPGAMTTVGSTAFVSPPARTTKIPGRGGGSPQASGHSRIMVRVGTAEVLRSPPGNCILRGREGLKRASVLSERQ